MPKIDKISRKNARVCLDTGESILVPSDQAIIGNFIGDSNFADPKNDFDQKQEILQEEKIIPFIKESYDIVVEENDMNIFKDRCVELEKQGYELVFYRSEYFPRKERPNFFNYAEFKKVTNDNLLNYQQCT
jgi:hypothetical protein